MVLADINKDNEVDWVDLKELGSYLQDKTDNPFSIGVSVQSFFAFLEPKIPDDPSAWMLTSNGHQWHSFTLKTNADSVRVIANPPGRDIILEISGGNNAPRRNYCAGERSDGARYIRRNEQPIHLAGCGAGYGQILIEEALYGIILSRYNLYIPYLPEEEEP